MLQMFHSPVDEGVVDGDLPSALRKVMWFLWRAFRGRSIAVWFDALDVNSTLTRRLMLLLVLAAMLGSRVHGRMTHSEAALLNGVCHASLYVRRVCSGAGQRRALIDCRAQLCVDWRTLYWKALVHSSLFLLVQIRMRALSGRLGGGRSLILRGWCAVVRSGALWLRARRRVEMNVMSSW